MDRFVQVTFVFDCSRRNPVSYTLHFSFFPCFPLLDCVYSQNLHCLLNYHQNLSLLFFSKILRYLYQEVLSIRIKFCKLTLMRFPKTKGSLLLIIGTVSIYSLEFSIIDSVFICSNGNSLSGAVERSSIALFCYYLVGPILEF